MAGGFAVTAAPAFSASEGSAGVALAVEPGAIDDFLEDQVGRHGIPGLSVAIIEDGQVSYTQGYGWAGP